jgi:GntR family transcriptional regulator
METAELERRLAVRVRDGGPGPVPQLVVDELWVAVVDGSLAGGERLPTSRELAVALNVSPRVIEGAYADLERRGVVATRPGSGTFVSLAPPSEDEHARHQELARLCRDVIRDAAELGFTVDDVLDVVAGHRSVDPEPKEPGR